jgi:hypothetical protein
MSQVGSKVMCCECTYALNWIQFYDRHCSRSPIQYTLNFVRSQKLRWFGHVHRISSKESIGQMADFGWWISVAQWPDASQQA